MKRYKPSKGQEKLASFFMMECKECDRKFALFLIDEEAQLLITQNEAVYCPCCGKKSEPYLWKHVNYS